MGIWIKVIKSIFSLGSFAPNPKSPFSKRQNLGLARAVLTLAAFENQGFTNPAFQ